MPIQNHTNFWLSFTGQGHIQEELASEPPPPVQLHPNLSEIYRQKVEQLTDALNADDTRQEAGEIIRSLIDEIRLVPDGDELRIHLKGELAEILALSTNKKPGSRGTGLKTTLVAGARNRLYLLLRIRRVPLVFR